jgi:hypothetical protein
MARDRVKTEIAAKVLSAIQYATGVVRYTLAEHKRAGGGGDQRERAGDAGEG